MKQYTILAIFALFVMLLASCFEPQPNANKKGEDQLKSLEISHPIDRNNMPYQDELYVPIYSDVYVDAQNQKTLLSATLSIRNTSPTDSLFVFKIDYYDTGGDLVKQYLSNTISLPPLGTVNYVIEKEDDTGGTGANFIVGLSANTLKIKPLVQALMIGHMGNNGFAFSTDGYSIEK